MRLRKMVARAALVAIPALGVAAPAHAANNNSECRHVTNEVRKSVHETVNLNQEINQLRNELCGNLPK
jgi:hypothetical protein